VGGRGFATAGLLILVGLVCIAVSKRLEGERRMIAKLRELRDTNSTGAVPLDGLSVVERDTLERLREAGVIRMDRTQGHINPEALRAFRGKRIRFALTGVLFASALVVLIALFVLRR
jgi:hypothetical protein